MTINANGAGELSGQFTIPASVLAGTKMVEFTGGVGTSGRALFTGAGDIAETVMQRQTSVFLPQPNITFDPLAQTFTVPTRTQVAGVDLWVQTVGTTPITVQIRQTEVGFPTQVILAEARIKPGDLVAGAFNRFLFHWPVTIRANQEQALVVLCDDAVGACGIAELGKVDIVSGAWVTSQPYQIGTLLSSANASTWTAHQDRDLTFKLLRYGYTSTQRTIALGTVPVVAATDLMVTAVLDVPDEATNVQFRLTLPDATVLTVANRQPVRLTTAITGDVAVSAILNGSADFSPILWGGTELVHGAIGTTGTYFTRAMPAGSDSRVRVIFDALLPPGSSVDVDISGTDISDTYASMPAVGSVAMDNGWREYTYETPDIDEAMVRVRVTLHGTAAARPYLRNVRMLVM
jgi:hypothetical protein